MSLMPATNYSNKGRITLDYPDKFYGNIGNFKIFTKTL